MLAMSKFDFDSIPPLARTFPSRLKDTEVTFRPIVPAVIVPSMLVIIAFKSAMFGMFAMFGRFFMLGLWPGFGVGKLPMEASGLKFWPGEEVSDLSRLP